LTTKIKNWEENIRKNQSHQSHVSTAHSTCRTDTDYVPGYPSDVQHWSDVVYWSEVARICVYLVYRNVYYGMHAVMLKHS